MRGLEQRVAIGDKMSSLGSFNERGNCKKPRSRFQSHISYSATKLSNSKAPTAADDLKRKG